jgi:putative membrane protein
VARAGRPQGFFKATGNYLGLSFAASNPRKVLKRARRPLGNLPLEILTYLAAFTDELVGSGQLPIPMTQTLACMPRTVPLFGHCVCVWFAWVC